ncbi:thioredoxin domain-containing protein [Haladaptatus sp. T7]|uniref:DsbA family protein n=1 Tax=Haladaptatus sp. T7 TaxID=2029368 RepID=UPI0021A259B9|nr:thioredoxin domain-containing protein [Haladaptatus sp. T7]GKZ14277.1 hypothetical protein HAL_21580 [Haladaptatus sp. T7]
MVLSRRRLLATTGVTVLGGCLGGNQDGASGGDSTDETTSATNGNSNPVASAPIPKNPGEHEYAIAGTGTADTTVRYFSNWKCPYCAQFSTGFLGEIVSEYVEPGEIDIELRTLGYFGDEPFLGPDAPRASEAGLAVWNVDPQSFWGYYEYVFSHQPSEKKQWATTDKLLSFMEKAGVKRRDEIKTQIESNEYESLLHQSDTAAQRAGVNSTPMLVIDGEAVVALKKDEVRKRLDSATK